MEIELSRLVRALRRFWWVVAVAMVAIGALAASLAALAPTTYTSETTLIVVPTNEQIGNVETIIEISSSDAVIRPILEQYGIEGTSDDYANDHLRAYSVPGTSLVRIEVSDENAQNAADIANAIAANTTARSYDVGLGLLQRNLNNLVFERDQVNLQLVTINTQIDQITSTSAEPGSEDQFRLDQLNADRMRLEQRRSDLETAIRASEREIATYVEPVMVSDVAVPAEESDGMSPVVLGAVGAVLGALLGAAIMLWLELRDRSVRDDWHLREVVATDSVMRVGRGEIEDAESAAINLVASRVVGVARAANAQRLLLVSPRVTSASQSFAEAVKSSPQLANLNVVTSLGLLDDGAGAEQITAETTALVIAEKDKTSEQDVMDVVEIMRDLGVTSVSAALLF